MASVNYDVKSNRIGMRIRLMLEYFSFQNTAKFADNDCEHVLTRVAFPNIIFRKCIEYTCIITESIILKRVRIINEFAKGKKVIPCKVKRDIGVRL